MFAKRRNCSNKFLTKKLYHVYLLKRLGAQAGHSGQDDIGRSGVLRGDHNVVHEFSALISDSIVDRRDAKIRLGIGLCASRHLLHIQSVKQLEKN